MGAWARGAWARGARADDRVRVEFSPSAARASDTGSTDRTRVRPLALTCCRLGTRRCGHYGARRVLRGRLQRTDVPRREQCRVRLSAAVGVMKRGDQGSCTPDETAGQQTHHVPQQVARGGVEPPTFRFSVGRSYQLSYLADTRPDHRSARASRTLPERSGGHENGARPAFPYADPRFWPPSSSGPGPRPFTAVARVRIPLGVRVPRLCAPPAWPLPPRAAPRTAWPAGPAL